MVHLVHLIYNFHLLRYMIEQTIYSTTAPVVISCLRILRIVGNSGIKSCVPVNCGQLRLRVWLVRWWLAVCVFSRKTKVSGLACFLHPM